METSFSVRIVHSVASLFAPRVRTRPHAPTRANTPLRAPTCAPAYPIAGNQGCFALHAMMWNPFDDVPEVAGAPAFGFPELDFESQLRSELLLMVEGGKVLPAITAAVPMPPPLEPAAEEESVPPPPPAAAATTAVAAVTEVAHAEASKKDLPQ